MMRGLPIKTRGMIGAIAFAVLPAVVMAQAVAPATAVPPVTTPSGGLDPSAMPKVVIGGGLTPPVKALEVQSLLYTPVEMAALHRAIEIYKSLSSGQGNEKGDEAQAFLKQLEEGGKKVEPIVDKYYTFPQFYMESLVYHGDDDWNVRINGQKLSKNANEGKDGIHVIAVNKDRATVEWKPKNLQKAKEIWDLAPNESINFDIVHGLVVFPLQPNQTFSSYSMRVIEGKVIPVVIENVPSNRLALPAPVRPSLGPTPDTKEGLDVLMDQYKNKKEKKQ